jgi:hypothetical protein
MHRLEILNKDGRLRIADFDCRFQNCHAPNMGLLAAHSSENTHERSEYFRWLVVLNFCLAVSLNTLMSQDFSSTVRV